MFSSRTQAKEQPYSAQNTIMSTGMSHKTKSITFCMVKHITAHVDAIRAWNDEAVSACW